MDSSLFDDNLWKLFIKSWRIDYENPLESLQIQKDGGKTYFFFTENITRLCVNY